VSEVGDRPAGEAPPDVRDFGEVDGIDPMERLAPFASRRPPVTIIPSVYQQT